MTKDIRPRDSSEVNPLFLSYVKPHRPVIVLVTGTQTIYIGRGPQIYEGVPISTIDMGMGVPVSMQIWGQGPQIHIVHPCPYRFHTSF